MPRRCFWKAFGRHECNGFLLWRAGFDLLAASRFRNGCQSNVPEHGAGPFELFEFDPFIGSMGLGDVAGSHNHAVKAGGGEQARIGAVGHSDRFGIDAVVIQDGGEEVADHSGMPGFERAVEIGRGREDNPGLDVRVELQEV